MRPKTISICPLICALSCILFSSCKKGDSVVNDARNNTMPAVSADSNYLSKMYLVEPNGPGNDTDIHSFYYDAQKRLIGMDDSTDENQTWGLVDNAQFVYNGSDTFCSRETLTYVETPDVDSTDYYFSYNSNGQKLRIPLLREITVPAALSGMFKL